MLGFTELSRLQCQKENGFPIRQDHYILYDSMGNQLTTKLVMTHSEFAEQQGMCVFNLNEALMFMALVDLWFVYHKISLSPGFH
jgi:hypothetical protein